MMEITDDWIKKKQEFEEVAIECPRFDVATMRINTIDLPTWVHFGGGNLYRCFHAKIAQDLLNNGDSQSGIVVADLFNQKLINQYSNNDNRTLTVVLEADGTMKKELLASTAEAYFLNQSKTPAVKRMIEIFQNPNLQIITATITEKGYTVKKSDGSLTSQAKSDIEIGANFELLQTTMGKIAYFLYKRYKAGNYPLALVSTDNFSLNGQRFKDSILLIAAGWLRNGYVEREFIDYLEDEQRITFPFSMIDRITPLPSPQIAEMLELSGIQGMSFPTGSSFAPFVNTEETHYLVIEDAFPNGRPPLEKAGVYMTDRETVNKTDLMKVCSCLNPLHTALSIFGCLLEYQYIWEEMQDLDLLGLIKQIGYVESLPVVADPGIIHPRKFLDEVIQKRFVNPFIPDTPQRIVTDTSQKMAIRYGETIKAYMASETLKTEELHFIPLTIAAWCRYLLGVNDLGERMMLSSDPLLDELQEQLKPIKLGEMIDEKIITQCLAPILSNDHIFGVDLYDTSIGKKVEHFFVELVKEKGAVRRTLSEEIKAKEDVFNDGLENLHGE